MMASDEPVEPAWPDEMWHTRVAEERARPTRHLDAVKAQRDRAEAGRLALIKGIDSIADYTDRLSLAVALGDHGKLNPEVVATELRALVAAAHDGHRRVWGEGR